MTQEHIDGGIGADTKRSEQVIGLFFQFRFQTERIRFCRHKTHFLSTISISYVCILSIQICSFADA
nr:MAG TPA: hypothetical protein [Caudoviricetes sp.]